MRHSRCFDKLVASGTLPFLYSRAKDVGVCCSSSRVAVSFVVIPLNVGLIGRAVGSGTFDTLAVRRNELSV